MILEIVLTVCSRLEYGRLSARSRRFLRESSDEQVFMEEYKSNADVANCQRK